MMGKVVIYFVIVFVNANPVKQDEVHETDANNNFPITSNLYKLQNNARQESPVSLTVPQQQTWSGDHKQQFNGNNIVNSGAFSPGIIQNSDVMQSRLSNYNGNTSTTSDNNIINNNVWLSNNDFYSQLQYHKTRIDSSDSFRDSLLFFNQDKGQGSGGVGFSMDKNRQQYNQSESRKGPIFDLSDGVVGVVGWTNVVVEQITANQFSVLSPPGDGYNENVEPPPGTLGSSQQQRQSSQSKESRLEKDNHQLEEYTDSSSIPRRKLLSSGAGYPSQNGAGYPSQNGPGYSRIGGSSSMNPSWLPNKYMSVLDMINKYSYIHPTKTRTHQQPDKYKHHSSKHSGSSMDSSYVNKWRNRARPNHSNQVSNSNKNSGSKYNFNQQPASKKGWKEAKTTESKVRINLLSGVARRHAAKAKVNYRQVEKKVLDNILAEDVYDPKMRPSGLNSNATIVNVNLYIRSFEKIDDVKMEYSLQITFRQQWNDNRLEFDSQDGKIKYLTMTEQSKVWMPDTFFRNEKSGRFHKILQPNLYVRVFPSGDLLYSIRVSLTLACPMNLKLFPLDTQTCHLAIASYGWTAADVIYAWKEPPVEKPKDLFLPGGFELSNVNNSKCDVETATGVYSCLSVDMVFKRQLSYYIVTIYVPTFMIVCVSWMSFWLDHKSAPARVALCVTTLLAMSTTTSSINNSLPPVAYTKAIDVWSNMCVSYVFLALLEYALVNYAARADARLAAARATLQKELEYVQTAQNSHYAVEEEKNDYYDDYDPHIRRIEGAERSNLLFAQLVPYELSVRSVLASWPSKHQPGAKKIDVLSRIMFPATFMTLNVMYWSYYLTRKTPVL